MDVKSLPHFAGFFGHHGAGKSSLLYALYAQAQEYNPWTPVISATPFAVVQPNTLFLTSHPGHMIAASLCLSSWLYSRQAKEIAKQWSPRGRSWRRFDSAIAFDRVDRGTIGPDFNAEVVSMRFLEQVKDVFKRLQEDYRELVEDTTWDWRDRDSINDLLAAFNQLVLHGRLGERVGDFRKVAKEYKSLSPVALADHVHGDFRFYYHKPAFRAIVGLDEVGVTAGADDNKELKASAVYPWMTAARRLACQVFMTGHHGSRVWVQMRQVVKAFCWVNSIELFGRGRVYVVSKYRSQENMEAREDREGAPLVFWVSYDTISRGSTLYNPLTWES